MNNYNTKNRDRGKTLLIVEGNHEKNKLFKLVLTCFSELNMNYDDIWVYGTNIYMLYDDITKEYGCDWAKDNDDIDLPLVISKKRKMEVLRYKEDFKNILLVFDYERHDPNFSEQKIKDMQRIFRDMVDMGKLYLNYPMLESYQHLKSLPDKEFLNRKTSINVQNGQAYKAMVEHESCIKDLIMFRHKIEDTLFKTFHVLDDKIRTECCDKILTISTDKDLLTELHIILNHVIDKQELEYAKHLYKGWITKVGYLDKKLSYLEYMKEIFKQIMMHNIWKAVYIQTNHNHLVSNKYREYFDTLDFIKILNEQNHISRKGDVWVLSTCLFLIPDYNFSFIE